MGRGTYYLSIEPFWFARTVVSINWRRCLNWVAGMVCSAMVGPFCTMPGSSTMTCFDGDPAPPSPPRLVVVVIRLPRSDRPRGGCVVLVRLDARVVQSPAIIEIASETTPSRDRGHEGDTQTTRG